MLKLYRRLCASAAILAAFAAPQAQAAVVLTLDSPALTGLYFPGDSFNTNGYTLTVIGDAGIVDTADPVSTTSPTGNSSQFYSQTNQGELVLKISYGGLFNLNGFDAAFIPLDPAAAGTSVMVAYATFANGSQGGVYWDFDISLTSHFPFMTYDNPADFGFFTNVTQIEFFACALVSGAVDCDPNTIQNNGQFAIDNISVVPEPGMGGLLALCLAGLALTRRRAVR